MPRLETLVDVQSFSGSTRRVFPNRWAGSLGEKALCQQETREMQVTRAKAGQARKGGWARWTLVCSCKAFPSMSWVKGNRGWVCREMAENIGSR